MKAPRLLARGLALLVTLAAVLVAGGAAAQTTVGSSPNWQYVTIFDDTTAVAMRDTSKAIDMTGFRFLTLYVTLTPAAGVGAWAQGTLQVLGSYKQVPDGTSTARMETQPVADHSYIGSAAGDSLSFGTWQTGTSTTPDNGEIQIRAAAPNDKWPFPMSYAIEVGNKGTHVGARTVYVAMRTLAASSGVPRWRIVGLKSN